MKTTQTNNKTTLMRVLAFVMLLVYCVLPIKLSAQTDRELLLDISKQVAVNNTKLEALEKNIDKRLDGMDKRLDFMQNLMLIIIPLIITSVLGIIGFIVWDRRTAIKPFETKTNELEKANEKLQQEIEILKAKELKAEQLFRGFAEIEPRFAEMYRKATVL